jgi:hypothetical protein
MNLLQSFILFSADPFKGGAATVQDFHNAANKSKCGNNNEGD